jgi:hypothetical protein
MRLLIYLLALMSGFSAAEAARAEVSPASSVAQTAVAAAEALASQAPMTGSIPVNNRPDVRTTFARQTTQVALVSPTPISRRDLLRI